MLKGNRLIGKSKLKDAIKFYGSCEYSNYLKNYKDRFIYIGSRKWDEPLTSGL